MTTITITSIELYAEFTTPAYYGDEDHSTSPVQQLWQVQWIETTDGVAYDMELVCHADSAEDALAQVAGKYEYTKRGQTAIWSADIVKTVKMVDWRTGETWTEKTTEELCPIPPRNTTLKLDAEKIAEAQRQSDKILSDFNRR